MWACWLEAPVGPAAARPEFTLHAGRPAAWRRRCWRQVNAVGTSRCSTAQALWPGNKTALTESARLGVQACQWLRGLLKTYKLPKWHKLGLWRVFTRSICLHWDRFGMYFCHLRSKQPPSKQFQSTQSCPLVRTDWNRECRTLWDWNGSPLKHSLKFIFTTLGRKTTITSTAAYKAVNVRPARDVPLTRGNVFVCLPVLLCDLRRFRDKDGSLSQGCWQREGRCTNLEQKVTAVTKINPYVPVPH